MEPSGQVVDISPSPIVLHKPSKMLLGQVKKSPRAPSSKTTAGKGGRQQQQQGTTIATVKLKGSLQTSSPNSLHSTPLVTSNSTRQSMESENEANEQLPFLPSKEIYDSSSSDGEDKPLPLSSTLSSLPTLPLAPSSLQPVSLQYGHESIMWTPSISSSSSSDSD